MFSGWAAARSSVRVQARIGVCRLKAVREDDLLGLRQMDGLVGGKVDAGGIEALEDLQVQLLGEIHEVPVGGQVIPDAEQIQRAVGKIVSTRVAESPDPCPRGPALLLQDGFRFADFFRGRIVGDTDVEQAADIGAFGDVPDRLVGHLAVGDGDQVPVERADPVERRPTSTTSCPSMLIRSPISKGCRPEGPWNRRSF